ncbi:MAG: hypothetical protein HN411_05785 [Waddliaceae bacterium]|jgi:hypothetical protein|nr:hypothetical protein [Waddliaceae bacterium]MBT3578845.1 hypothetical protein [Waddliaceae bacterium]MBT4444629.1 hypothetical protein [Waddliaceae bacterium]MBT6928803.1 hypothetical protein [Waddliaceae bacterium]MBT7263856.1 hypothetical protein [Waddliaceae bacterium]
MKKIIIGAILISFAFILSGCDAKGDVATSSAAIDKAKTLETVEVKVDYLLEQAEYFYDTEQYQEAVDLAEYILKYLDKNSPEAKKLLEDAKDALLEKVNDEIKGFSL